MTAKRVIDDHIELANIGTKTHAEIDTHIAAADNYVKRDGSLALTADWDIGDTRKILADEIRARDGDGLKLYDDGGNGVLIKDGGNVCIEKLTVSNSGHEDSGSGSFHLVEDGDAVRFRAVNYSNVFWHVPYFIFSRARGTASARLYPQANDNLFEIISTGWSESNNAWVNCVAIAGATDGNWSAGNYPAQLEFRTGTTGTLTSKLVIKSDGKIGVNTLIPTTLFDLNSDIFRVRTAKTPASAGAAGNTGDRAWDADYFYICVATNTWERTAHNTW